MSSYGVVEPARGPVVVNVITRMILGGPTRPVATSLQGLARRGWRPVLITGEPGRNELADTLALEAMPGVSVLHLPGLVRRPSPRRDLSTLAALVRTLRRLRPAVLHTHTAKAGALGRLARLLIGRNRPAAFHTFHGHSMTEAAAGAWAPAWTAIERLLARGATDVIVTLSPGQRSEIVRHLGPAAARRTVVLPLAFDRVFRAPGAEEEARRFAQAVRGPGERVLAFVGRGVPAKGLVDLARAYVQMASLHPRASACLRMALIGPIEPSVAAGVLGVLREAGAAERWLVWGPTAHPQALLGVVDGLVLPSHSEGTPVSVLEALSEGLPVIGSAVGGVPELLASQWDREGPGRWRCVPAAPRGWLVPAGDASAWADRLRRFAAGEEAVPGDPDERRAFVARTFDPDRHVADLVALYVRAGVVEDGALQR